MKKTFFLNLILAFTLCASSVAMSSCSKDKDDDPIAENKDNGNNNESEKSTIVGEWSGIREKDEFNSSADVFVHFNFKADGTFEQTMPAWEEINYGEYSISGDIITFKLNSIEWLWDRGNGYDNAYDQYSCYWYPDRFDENRQKYSDPFAQFTKGWPGRVNFSAKFSFNKEGNLLLTSVSGEGAGFGLQLVYYKNPGFKPQRKAE